MQVRDFLIKERGLTPETFDEFGVTFDGDMAMFPYGTGIKYRVHKGDERRMWFDKGATPDLFGMNQHDWAQPVMFLVEGESDTMRLAQELDEGASVLGLSGTNGWDDDYAEAFDTAETVYVILDNDTNSQAIAAADECFRQIRKSLGRKAVRLYLPKSPTFVKDICEFFDNYDLDTLRMIAESAPAGDYYYRSLNLKVPAPPVDWLVNEFIGRGDVVLWVGEPDVGKSWLMLSLAVAIADGGEKWLGHTVNHHGRVLFVDEENPEDIVRQRMERLGLKKDSADQIRYLHHQGVRLDRYPDRLLDEAVSFQPELIILDSLTRLHTGDENNAGHMAALFNDGINPLARETGATVCLLHHVNKSDATSGFGRARGSGDITASIDAGLDVRKIGNGRLNVVHFKSRRKATGGLVQASIVDTPDGRVEITVAPNPVF